MFCFENAMFETCKPILVVYIVFIFCVALIIIVLLRCLRASFVDTKDDIENRIENETPKVIYVQESTQTNQFLRTSKSRPNYQTSGTGSQLESDILSQQLAIYKMANYNLIQPSYIWTEWNKLYITKYPYRYYSANRFNKE